MLDCTEKKFQVQTVQLIVSHRQEHWKHIFQNVTLARKNLQGTSTLAYSFHPSVVQEQHFIKGYTIHKKLTRDKHSSLLFPTVKSIVNTFYKMSHQQKKLQETNTLAYCFPPSVVQEQHFIKGYTSHKQFTRDKRSNVLFLAVCGIGIAFHQRLHQPQKT